MTCINYKKKVYEMKWSNTNRLEINTHQMEMEFTLTSGAQWWELIKHISNFMQGALYGIKSMCFFQAQKETRHKPRMAPQC